jgi:uncharacterized protein (TIGR02266 family)
MVDERRRDSRSRSSGVVRCESATGNQLVSRWLDLGLGGLFVEADPPMAVGTLLVLEIEIPGEGTAASTTGRVIWIRERPTSDGKPPGMGVSFTYADDAMLTSIRRFLAGETPSARAQSPSALPSRERTVLGVGLSAQTPAAAASPRIPLPSREKTTLGVVPITMSGGQGQPRALDREKSLQNADDLPAWPDEPPTATMASSPTAPSQRHEESRHIQKGAVPDAEPSLPMDLVRGKKPAAPDVAAAAPSIPAGESGERRGWSRSSEPGELREPSISLPGRRSTRRGVGAFVFVLLVLTLAGGGYVYRARLWPWVARYPVLRTALARIAPTPVATPAPPASVAVAPPPIGTPGGSSLASAAPSAAAVPPAPSLSATAKAGADAGARGQGATLDASAGIGLHPASTHRPAPQAPKHRPAAATEAAADTPP